MLVFAGLQCAGHGRSTIGLLVEALAVQVMDDVGHEVAIIGALLLAWVIQVNRKGLMFYNDSPQGLILFIHCTLKLRADTTDIVQYFFLYIARINQVFLQHLSQCHSTELLAVRLSTHSFSNGSIALLARTYNEGILNRSCVGIHVVGSAYIDKRIVLTGVTLNRELGVIILLIPITSIFSVITNLCHEFASLYAGY